MISGWPVQSAWRRGHSASRTEETNKFYRGGAKRAEFTILLFSFDPGGIGSAFHPGTILWTYGAGTAGRKENNNHKPYGNITIISNRYH